MNRGPFIRGMARYTTAANEGNQRRKKISRGRIIFNISCMALGLIIVAFVLFFDLTEAFLVGAIFLLVLCSIPFTMTIGKDLLMYELEIVINQHRAELPLSFNRKKAICGYILMFAPLYILMMGCFFFPAEGAWVVPYFPIFLYTLLSAVLANHTVSTFEFSTVKYKLIHISLFVLIFVGGLILRGTLLENWISNIH